MGRRPYQRRNVGRPVTHVEQDVQHAPPVLQVNRPVRMNQSAWIQVFVDVHIPFAWAKHTFFRSKKRIRRKTGDLLWQSHLRFRFV